MSTELAESKGVTNPLTLLEKMIDKGGNADQLSKMMDLAERWQKNQAAQAYSEAMSHCQAEMPAIHRDKQNTHTKNRYASWESLNELIRPVYSKHGFSLTFTEDPTRSTEANLWMLCHCRHEQGHVETVQGIFPRDGAGAKGGQIAMSPIQAVGSTRSYSKRYLAKDLFALAETDEDNDGNSTGEAPLTEAEIKWMKDSLEAVYGDDWDAWMKWINTKVEPPAERVEDLTRDQYAKGRAALMESLKRLAAKKEKAGAK